MYRVPLLEFETVTSFCSRLAAANIKTASEFCSDMGLQFTDIVHGSECAIRKLSELANVPVDQLKKATVIKNGRNWIVGAESILNKFYGRTRLRGCPLCFIADEQSLDRLPGTRMYVRRDWALQFVRSCKVHDCSLVDFGQSPMYAERRFDFLESAQAIGVNLRSGSIKPRKMTAFELFALDRLDGVRKHGAILDALPLDRAGVLCQILGSELLHRTEGDQDFHDDQHLWRAEALGYDYLSNGLEGLRRALDAFHSTVEISKSHLGGPWLYGRFYKLLWYQGNLEFDQIRKAVHDHAFATLPLSSSANVFGTKEKTEFLSSRQVTETFGMRPSLLRKLAVAHGLLETCSLKKGVISASVAHATYALAVDSVGAKDAAALAGLPLHTFKDFAKAGIFTPSLEANQALRLGEQFSKAAIQCVVDSIRPSRPRPRTTAMCHINDAARLCGYSASKIAQLLQKKSLTNVSWDGDRAGIDAVLVCPEEIRSTYLSSTTETLTVKEAAKALRIAGGALRELCEAGQLRRHVGKLRRDVSVGYFAAEEVAEFSRRYTTLHKAAMDLSIPRTELRSAVEQFAVPIAISMSTRFGDFYLRSELGEVLKKAQSTSGRCPR